MATYDNDETELLGPLHHERHSVSSSSFQPLEIPYVDDEWSATSDLGVYELDNISSHEGLNTASYSHKPSNSGYTPLLPPDEFTRHPEDRALPPGLVDGSVTSIRRKRGWFFNGWRVGVISNSCMTAAILLLNVILTSWASLSFPMNNNIGTLINGDCNKSKNWALWLHLAINALSTLLLGASNYTMQVLMGPTRREVDKAHAEGSYFVIGVAAVTNLTSMSWSRLVLFVLLIISSVPLHLLYNSAIFETLTARDYSVFVVSESFLHGGTYNENLTDYTWRSTAPYPPTEFGWEASDNEVVGQSSLIELQKNLNNLERLSPSECIAAYTTTFLTDRGSLLAVTNSSFVNTTLAAGVGATSNGSVYGWYQMRFSYTFQGSTSDPLAWICGDIEGYDAATTTCSITMAQPTASDWTIFNQTIAYCLSEPKDGLCTLEFSLVVMIAVIVANALKAICMALTVWNFHDEHPLITVGDATASFLEHPDPSTKGSCLFNLNDFTGPLGAQAYTIDSSPKPFTRTHPLWLRAPSIGRWTMTFLLCTVAMAVCGALLNTSIRQLSLSGGTSLTDLWNLGFGTINVRSLISFSTGSGDTYNEPILSMVLLANTPQIILSTLYFMYNAIYTSMLSENEWQHFSYQRKTLRVSTPTAQQRSTYFLSLPYRYAVPLMAISSLMHWLVSQSIFLAKVTILDEDETPIPEDELTTCGWSSIAIIFVIIVGALMLIVAFATGLCRFKGFMPVAGGRSTIISAACHPHELDTNASVLPVQWGVIDEAEPGHCTLTSRFVREPVPGKLYT